MKKNLLKMTIILLLLMLIPQISKASTATCVYEHKQNGTDTVTIKYEYGKLPVTSASGRNYKNIDITIKNTDIVDSNGNISCPQAEITVTPTDKGRYSLKFEVDPNGNTSGTLQITKNDGAEINTPLSNNHICHYHENYNTEYTLSWVGNKVIVDLIGSNFKNRNYCEAEIRGLTAAHFADGNCPEVFDKVVSRFEGPNGCKGKLIISTASIMEENEIPNEAGSKENVDTGNVEDYDNVQNPDIQEFSDCQSLLGDPKIKGTPAYYLVVAFNVIKYVALILLIVLSILDYVSAIASQDQDIIMKTTQKVIMRVIICVVIFLLPTLIKVILGYLSDRAADLCGIGG